MTTEEMRRLRAFDFLNAVADITAVSMLLLYTFTPAIEPQVRSLIYMLVAIIALTGLVWHVLVPRYLVSSIVLFAKHILDVGFVAMIVLVTGQEESQFFFLYFLIITGMAASAGPRQAFLIALLSSTSYFLVTGLSIDRLVFLPKAFNQVWTAQVSLWVVAFVSAFIVHESSKARLAAEEAMEKVELFSKTDWLTGLFNMKHFEKLAAQELSRSERHNHPFSVILTDSDHLKSVNDTYGHQRGDQLIVELARLLTMSCRVSDTVFRYGGDEFVVLLPETDAIGARFVGERMRAAVEQTELKFDQNIVHTSISVGIASWPKDGGDIMVMLERADSACYYSKQSGRNRVTTYASGMAQSERPDAKAVSHA